MEIRHELLCAYPTIITQRNLEYILFEHCATYESAWKGPNCVAIWRIKYKPQYYPPRIKALTRAYFFKKWSEKQQRFEKIAHECAQNGIEFMGDLSQNWPFETYYKVQIGEIKLYA